MTGYGKGERISEGRRFKVEIKSVNHRYSDITIKLPRFLNPYEDELRKRLAREISRGKTDVYINYETFAAGDVRVSVNAAFADAYESALSEIAARYGISGGVTLQVLASHPEIFSIEKDSYDDDSRASVYETLNAALDSALAAFNGMREAEGGALKRDLLEKNASVGFILGQIKARSKEIEGEHAARLRERIAEALKGTGYEPEEGRLLTEIAIFAEKSCIDEEITRLESHISQMESMLSQEESPGRKLDFLMQEFNREANTIGSKSNDRAITKLMLDLKAEIEKMREQVQNIE